MTLLTIRDETFSGDSIIEFSLEIPHERITLRELIQARVYQEVRDRQVRAANRFRNPIVAPSELEQELNGEKKVRKLKATDWQEEFMSAIQAFLQKMYLVIVDEEQKEDLDEELIISSQTAVCFVQLIKLRGHTNNIFEALALMAPFLLNELDQESEENDE